MMHRHLTHAQTQCRFAISSKSIRIQSHIIETPLIRRFTHTKFIEKSKINATTDTHIVLGILVGAGIQQQPKTVRVTFRSGQNQRCASALRVFAILPSLSHPRHHRPSQTINSSSLESFIMISGRDIRTYRIQHSFANAHAKDVHVQT